MSLPASASASRQPNIVLLMPDQLRWDYLGCYGADFAGTPHIDALARAGRVFERALSPSPICIPARASLLTGHNAGSTGVLTNNYWLRPDHAACGMPSLATLLTEAGYHTEAIGKMHFIPWDLAEGFTHRVIAEDKRHIHIRDDYADYLAEQGLRKLAGPEEPGYSEHKMASYGFPLPHQVDTWIGARSVDFLQNYRQENPFFLWVAFAGPHDPYNPPQELAAALDGLAVPPAIAATADSARFRPGLIKAHLGGSAQVDLRDFPAAAKARMRRHYVALNQIIDQQVGAILQALQNLDNGRDTLLLFTSDHGDFLGDFDLVGKALFYEPAIHIPLIMAGAGVTPGRSQQLVSLTDLFATIARAAALNPATQDSVALPVADSQPSRSAVFGLTGAGAMLSTRDWKLARYRNGLATLHHLVDDPQEQHNRYADPAAADVRAELEQQLMTCLLGSLTDGHADKAYPYMTMTPDHPGHARGWQRPYPAASWSAQEQAEAWAKAGIPL